MNFEFIYRSVALIMHTVPAVKAECHGHIVPLCKVDHIILEQKTIRRNAEIETDPPALH